MLITLKKNALVWYQEVGSQEVKHRKVLDISPNGSCVQLGSIEGKDYIWIAVADIEVLDQDESPTTK